jgi:hypothetical protein
MTATRSETRAPAQRVAATISTTVNMALAMLKMKRGHE